MAMQSFQMQPLEIEDFSGGLTDNSFDSGPTRYAAADNFLITVDRKLQVRPGTIPFDPVNYLLPGQPRRVDALFTYINESILLVNQGRDILSLPEVINPVWTSIIGPGNNEAIGAGGSYSIVTMGEYQRQAYFASDAQPIPSRVYRDETNAYTVRTAGLPRVQDAPLWDDASLLAKCISNANALRTSMLAHFADFLPAVTPTNTNLHNLEDTVAEGFINAVPVASDLPTLLALVGAENQAFTEHNTTGIAAYHYAEFVTHGPNSAAINIARHAPLANLTNPLVPTTLQIAAAMLDDLYQKWYWHQMAVNLHGFGIVNDYALMHQYIVPNSKIGPLGYDSVNKVYLKQSPHVEPDYQDFYNYVNGLVAMYNAHLGGGGNTQLYVANPNFGFMANSHTAPDQVDVVTLPIVTTLDDAYLTIVWLRVLYSQQHLADAGAFFPPLAANAITFDTTAGSPNITNVKFLIGGAPIVLIPGYMVWMGSTGFFGSPTPPVFTAAAGFEYQAAVVASAAGTATLDRNAINTAVGYVAGHSFSFFHGNFTPNSTFPQPLDGNQPVSSAEKLSSNFFDLGTDLTSWNALAQELMYALFNHMWQNLNHPVGTGSGATLFNPTDTPTIPQWWIPTVSILSYGFTYFYKYTVEPNGLEFQNESNPVFTDSFETIEPYFPGYLVPAPTAAQTFINADLNFTLGGPVVVTTPPTTINYISNDIQISQIPVLVNDASTNYDTANIDVKIYRTASGGTTFFYVGSVDNGTTTFSDSFNSFINEPGLGFLIDQPLLYTSGGVVGNDQPPQSKYIHILNGVAYYGNIIDTGQYFPNRIRQSLPNNPDSAPATFFDDFEDEITGLSSVRNNLIVFCKNSIYRESGGFNSLGQGQLTHEKISDSIGCIGAHSIVRTEIGCFFGGNDGFYYTDGFQLIKISIDLNDSYRAFTSNINQKKRVVGAYDKLNRRIWWSVQESPTDTDCNKSFIYYLDYGVKPGGVFTTASNDGSLVPTAANPSNYDFWRPGAVVFYQGQLIRGDERGLLFKTDSNTKTDPKIDLSVNASLWGEVPLPWDYTSTEMDFGTHYKRKWVTKINVTGKNVGDAAVQITSNSDNGRVIKPLAPINYVDNCYWGNPNFVWGDSNFSWKYDGKLDAWRRYPASSLRANLRAISLKPARIGIYRSEDFPNGCTATTDIVLKTVTIATPAGFTNIVWPIDVVDYYISFSIDDYTEEFLVTAVAGNTITISDPGNLLLTLSNSPWVIRGYKKNARFELSAYVIHFALLGDKTSAYTSLADSGENT